MKYHIVIKCPKANMKWRLLLHRCWPTIHLCNKCNQQPFSCEVLHGRPFKPHLPCMTPTFLCRLYGLWNARPTGWGVFPLGVPAHRITPLGVLRMGWQVKSSDVVVQGGSAGGGRALCRTVGRVDVLFGLDAATSTLKQLDALLRFGSRSLLVALLIVLLLIVLLWMRETGWYLVRTASCIASVRCIAILE